MRTVVVISVLIGVAMVPAAILAAPMDGSAPMLAITRRHSSTDGLLSIVISLVVTS